MRLKSLSKYKIKKLESKHGKLRKWFIESRLLRRTGQIYYYCKFESGLIIIEPCRKRKFNLKAS